MNNEEMPGPKKVEKAPKVEKVVSKKKRDAPA
jgi:hypothetical protein